MTLPQLKTTRLPMQPRCPRCAKLLDAATDIRLDGGRATHPGDLSLCAYCGLALVFEADFGLRRATLEEAETIRKQRPELWEVAQVRARRFAGKVN